MLHSTHFEAHHEQTREALEQTELFSFFTPEITCQMMSAADIIVLEKGESLYFQGDEADWFYFILAGHIKIYRETQDGDEAIIDILAAGDFVAEINVMGTPLHGDSAAATDQTTAIRLPLALLQKAASQSSAVAMELLKRCTEKRLRQSQEIESLKLQNAPQRIGCFILRHCKGQAGGERTLQLPYEKSLIATQLGMQGETFSRAFSKLKSATGIAAKGADLNIPDIHDLSQFVCSGCSNEYPCKSYMLAK